MEAEKELVNSHSKYSQNTVGQIVEYIDILYKIPAAYQNFFYKIKGSRQKRFLRSSDRFVNILDYLLRLIGVPSFLYIEWSLFAKEEQNHKGGAYNHDYTAVIKYSFGIIN